jgi:polyvinyl alcohol dehydrogenase (cytochrome)
MKRLIPFSLLYLTLAVAWIVPNPPTGEELYLSRCTTCHGGAVKEAPRLEALQMLTSTAIVKSLETGVMKTQGATLTPKERLLVANFLSKVAPSSVNNLSGQCSPKAQKASKSKALVTNWGNGLTNLRHFESSKNGISTQNIAQLSLKWVFAFPDATRARVQPTLAGSTLFTANQNGLVYALDRASGCIQWTFQAEDEVRSAIVVDADKNGKAKRLFFSDFQANVYAFDVAKKQLLWKVKVDEHPAATVTGTLVLHKDQLYIPVSSTEVLSAYNSQYPCCNFRGSVVALSADDGAQVWKTYTIKEEPQPRAKNKEGVQNFGPSGAPVWSSPTIDVKRNCLYVGTGENYSHPTTTTSDAIIAMSLSNGEILWSNQTQIRDAWNAACVQKGLANCPDNHGPDYDFGAPPILVSQQNKPDLLLAGQKSGMVFAFNPDDKGSVIWQQRVGRGGIMGGVHWGMASDGKVLYVPINDREAWEIDKDKPARPGLHALDVETGKIRWSKIEENRCKGDEKWSCGVGLSAAISMTNDLVFGGALDGILHAYDVKNGTIVWEFDTNKDFQAVNQVKAFGGAIDSGGAVIVDNQVFINSGYAKFGEKSGNVLLCFEIKKP